MGMKQYNILLRLVSLPSCSFVPPLLQTFKRSTNTLPCHSSPSCFCYGFSSASRPVKMSSGSSVVYPSQKLDNIKEHNIAKWLPTTCVAPPDTPTEMMEFLGRSWSISAKELSKALQSSRTNPVTSSSMALDQKTMVVDSLLHHEEKIEDSMSVKEPTELFLLHQALHPKFLSNQQLLQNGLMYKSILRGNKTMVGKWQRERKKHEIRTHKAQLHAAVFVAGVAAAVVAITASNVVPHAEEMSSSKPAASSVNAAIASAAALVASHCIEIAEDMGADHHQILSMVNSSISVKTNGDILTLTAGAATALRGAAILKARLQNGYGTGATAYVLGDEINVENGKEQKLTALRFVSNGGELLKRTREGALQWKQVSFSINSTFQVVVKLKSTHMAGTFTKKKKFVFLGVYPDIPAWPGRESWEDDSMEHC